MSGRDASDGGSKRAVFHVAPLRTLEQKLEPSHTAVVVVDVQNDFCDEDGMMAREGLDTSAPRALAERLPGLLDAAREAGALVIFIRNEYSTERNWYLSEVWLEQAERRREGSYTTRPVCPPDSWSNDFYGEVRPHAGDPIVTKHRFDAFLNTDLETILRANGVRTVVPVGIATNVCVETTVRNAFLRDYYVVLPADGCATFSPEEHDTSLQNIDKYFGQVVQMRDVISIWQEADREEGRPREAARSASA